ncbi:ethylbenzene dehydrogenase-related protein [Pseudoalteromonas xiamenensis]
MQRFIFVFLHTLVTISVLISLLTGLRIASLTRETWLFFDGLLPQGLVHFWHLFSSVLLILCILAYPFYFLKKRRGKTGAANVKQPLSYHRSIKNFGYTLLILACVSGLAKAFDATWLPLSLHYWVAMGVIGYLVLHSYVYFLQFGKKLLSQLWIAKQTFPLLMLLGFTVSVTWLLIPKVGNSLHQAIEVSTIPADVPITIDGIANESFWKTAPTLTVMTHSGVNFDDGSTPVTIQAVHNKEESYFYFTWVDETQSLSHLPLVKTSNGWKVTENGFYQFDEKQHYEDKFAVMLSNSCQFAADNVVHLGSSPLPNKPSNWHKKGYHASLDGHVRDLWHWKAIRTNDMMLADDNYFGAPITPRTGERRYTAGYQTDGKESGAYIMNWQWYKKDAIIPRRLPNPSTKYSTEEVLPWFGSAPYQTQHDTYPLGTTLPSVLYRSNRFEGDRADVRAHAQYADGRWHLEMARKNDTHSDKDVALKSGVCLWVAAFDGAQIAHTHHMQGIKLAYQGDTAL